MEHNLTDSTLTRNHHGLEHASGFTFHERYFDLLQETHARTAIGINSPCLCTHLVFMSGENGASHDRKQIEQLAKAADIHSLELESNHAQLQTERGLLKWARHTEFSTFTFFENNPQNKNGRNLADIFDPAWNLNIGGKLLLALRIHTDDAANPVWWNDWEKKPSTEPSGCLSNVNGGKSLVWYNFMPQKDGFLHLYVRDSSGNERVRGRVVQRLLDIETYRTLALLALPEVKRIGPMVADFDTEIANMANDLASQSDVNDEELLHRLTTIAARIEDLSVQAQFRLSASSAYAQIVQSRLEDLREEKIEGYQRLSNFILRRLLPAVRTFEAIIERQEGVSARVSRISNLLRARVDVELEKQNQTLLTSMDQRATQQLQLQKTVEGLSVIAISYYLIGIFLYFFKPLKKLVGWESGDMILIVAVPIILLGVWMFITKLRNSEH